MLTLHVPPHNAYYAGDVTQFLYKSAVTKCVI